MYMQRLRNIWILQCAILGKKIFTKVNGKCLLIDLKYNFSTFETKLIYLFRRPIYSFYDSQNAPLIPLNNAVSRSATRSTLLCSFIKMVEKVVLQNRVSRPDNILYHRLCFPELSFE